MSIRKFEFVYILVSSVLIIFFTTIMFAEFDRLLLKIEENKKKAVFIEELYPIFTKIMEGVIVSDFYKNQKIQRKYYFSKVGKSIKKIDPDYMLIITFLKDDYEKVFFTNDLKAFNKPDYLFSDYQREFFQKNLYRDEMTKSLIPKIKKIISILHISLYNFNNDISNLDKLDKKSSLNYILYLNKKVLNRINYYEVPKEYLLKNTSIFYMPIIDPHSKDHGMIRLFLHRKNIKKYILKDTRIINLKLISYYTFILSAFLFFNTIMLFIILKPVKFLLKKIVNLTGFLQEIELMKFSKSYYDVSFDGIEDIFLMFEKNFYYYQEKIKQLNISSKIQRSLSSVNVNEFLEVGKDEAFENDYCKIFAYYSGLRELSGDYYYHKKISDNEHFIIKCDVSGKDVVASIKTIQIATIVYIYLDQNKDNVADENFLKDLLKMLNKFFCINNYANQFSTVLALIFNESTGYVRVCNAGDPELLIYDKQKDDIMLMKLFESTVIGINDSENVDYLQNTFFLSQGDFIMSFTDGITESVASYNNAEEEFGMSRIIDILRSINKKEKYSLKLFDKEILFNFSYIDNYLESVIDIILSIEKIFRFDFDYEKNPTDNYSFIEIDKRICECLSIIMPDFEKYFEKPAKENMLKNTYANLKENPQHDDITIFVLQKNIFY